MDNKFNHNSNSKSTYYRPHPETAGSSANERCANRMNCRWFDDPNHLSCPTNCGGYEGCRQ